MSVWTTPKIRLKTMALVEEFGYTPEVFAAARVLLEEADSVYKVQGIKMGNRVSIGMETRQVIEGISKRFKLYAKMITRDYREDEGIIYEFNLAGRRDNTVLGKVREPKAFYQNCLEIEKLRNIVLKYGLTPEKLQACLDEIADLEQNNQVKALIISESEKTNEDKHLVFQELKDWWINYKSVLKFIYEDDAQMLERFSIKAYSPEYKARRKKKRQDELNNGRGDGDSGGSEEPSETPGETPSEAPTEEPTETPSEEPVETPMGRTPGRGGTGAGGWRSRGRVNGDYAWVLIWSSYDAAVLNAGHGRRPNAYLLPRMLRRGDPPGPR